MPPAVSVLTAVHDPERSHLEACLASVADQTTGDWEHVLVDDGSTLPHVGEVLTAAAAADSRVRVVRRSEQGGIVAASRDALAAASGECVALLDHDDVLEPTALATMAGALAARPDADLAYSDHDLLRPDGLVASPAYKPDFSPEQLRNQNYVLHLVVARRDAVAAVGGFREGFDGAQDHDLLLRLTERNDRVVHVPEVLYHWRQAEASVAADPTAKPWAYDAGRRAVQEHCDRVGIDAVVEPGTIAGTYRVRRRLGRAPRISVVIPTRGSSRRVLGLERCFVAEAVRSLVERSTYPDLEFVVVYDTGTPDGVLAYLHAIAGDRLVLVEFSGAFNFSEKINAGVAASSGELVFLLNDDTELIAPDSLEVMAALLEDDTVGMVGPKLLYPDGTIQDGGHVYNEHVLAGLVGWHGTSPGPGQLRPLAVDREVSGVTAAAALMRRAVFDEIGGFDPVLFINFNDVDVSLKVRATGRRIIWTPSASWYHFESQTRAPSAEPEEWAEIDRRWHDEINADPYYNPNYEPRRSDWLERPWHSGAPELERDDAEQSTASWLLDRLGGTISGSSSSASWQVPLLAIVALLAAWLLGHEAGAGGGPARFVLVAIPAVVVWSLLLALTFHRRRWVLAAALLLAVAPAALGLLAAPGWSTVAWTVTVLGATLLGPISRARPLAAWSTALALVALDLLVWWRDAARAPASDDRWWAFPADVVAAFGSADGAWNGVSVLVWWAGLLALVALMAREHHWQGAGAVVAGIVVLIAASAVIDSSRGATAATAALPLLVGVVVAAAARIDHEASGAHPLMVGALAVTAVAWTSALFAASDAFWQVVVGIAVAGAVVRVAVGMADRRWTA